MRTEKIREQQRAYYLKHRDVIIARSKERKRLKPRDAWAGNLKKFGITPDDYERMLAEQNGVCAICKNCEAAARDGRPLRLAVDHSHTSGAVRKLLCTKCNTMLGGARDSVEVLQAAIDYLKAEGK
jgi:hypothetical protein